jgi:hypothetical protein
VVHGLKSQNFFPAIGANGPATIHVNLGQAGFVFIEANVKKWGLAPVTGSLAPPPPYGSEQGSILLETGTKDGFTGSQGQQHSQSLTGTPFNFHGSSSNTNSNSNLNSHHGRSRSGTFRVLHPNSPGPVRSPTDISLAHLVPNDENGEASNSLSYQQSLHSSEHHDGNPLHLHLEDAANPPPDYASPDHSDREGNQESGSDTEDDTPLIRVANRSRGASSATARPSQTPFEPSPHPPGYNDAIRQGASRSRSYSIDSADSIESAESTPSVESTESHDAEHEG